MSTAVAKRAATAVTHQTSISELVVQINMRIYDANGAQIRCNKLRLKAGQLLLQLRKRIEAGEEGDVGWWEWFGNLGNNGHPSILLRGRKDAERLMRIASAEDPEQALEDDNAKARERMRKLRDGANVRSKPKGMMPDGNLVLETFTPCGTPLAYRDRDGDYKLGAMPAELRAEYAAAAEIVERDDADASQPLGDSIEEARFYYAAKFAELSAEEQREEAKQLKFLMARVWKRASTLPQDGRSDGGT
jgi:hypothetical protein